MANSIHVTNLNDSGVGSLRAAIEYSNANPNTTILFDVTGVITLVTALPSFLQTTIVDGTSAPGFTDRPLVEIDCCKNKGIKFEKTAAGSQLLGLAITHAYKDGVSVYSAETLIHKNFIGLGLLGLPKPNAGYGLYIQSNNNKIGINPYNVSAYFSNVICANLYGGIYLYDCRRNELIKNYVGIGPEGKVSIPNMKSGIVFNNAHDNIIGGMVYTNSDGITNNPTGSKNTVERVFIIPPQGNLVSGNHDNGILLHKSHRNTFYGNFVGTTSNGNLSIPNNGNGVLLKYSHDNSFLGCSVVDNPFVYYNVFSGNKDNGLEIFDSNNTTVQGNFFGIAAENLFANPNGKNGILVSGKSDNTTVGGIIPLGNTCAGNKRAGIAVVDKASNFITFNTFGGLAPFGGAVPNRDGIVVSSTGSGIILRTNVFSGNFRNGIHLTGDSNGVKVTNDIASLATNGENPMPNGQNSILIDKRSHHNVVDSSDPSVIIHTTLSEAVRSGIEITDEAHHNVVTDCNIGIDLFGFQRVLNGCFSVELSGYTHDNDIVGNYITGNIILRKHVKGNKILDNKLDVTRRDVPLGPPKSKIINESIHDNTVQC